MQINEGDILGIARQLIKMELSANELTDDELKLKDTILGLVSKSRDFSRPELLKLNRILSA